MTNITIPVVLVSIVMIAGIFAFMPVDKATTVHTTIQGTQLNNINSTFDTDMSTNATASCGSAGGDFLVYWTFSNSTAAPAAIADGGDKFFTTMAIDDGNGLSDPSPDINATLILLNHTSASGVFGGSSGETITFSDALNDGEDVGDLMLTVVCQSGSTPALVP